MAKHFGGGPVKHARTNEARAAQAHRNYAESGRSAKGSGGGGGSSGGGCLSLFLGLLFAVAMICLSAIV